jgi:hypothetical protein
MEEHHTVIHGGENPTAFSLVQRVQTSRRSGEIHARGVELEEGIDEIFSGLVPRFESRLASQTSRRLGIGSPFDGGKLAIDTQAFLAHFLRGLG